MYAALNSTKHHLFRVIVGKLRFSLDVIPDLADSVRELSKHMAAPNTEHWENMLRVLRYCKGTKDV